MNMTLKNDKLRVLNLEDNPNDSELIRSTLESEWPGVEWLRVDSRATFLKALEEFKPDVVLSDFQLPDMNGQEALNIVRQFHPEIPVVMVTGALSDIDAVELVKLGARDYVIKDRLHRLISAVHGALAAEQGIRARKLAEIALRESEADMRALIEYSPIATIVDTGIDADGKVVVVNRKFTELFGYTLADLPNVSYWWPLAYPDKEYREKIQADFEISARQAILSGSKTKPIETTVTCKDGSIRHVKITFAHISQKNIVTFEDLTEHKQAEIKIKRLNQLYALLSHCNQTIVRSKDEQDLFAHICQIAVQFGDFKMAWIGRVNPDTQMLVPIASAGVGAEEYLRDIKISVDANSEYGQGPTGSALRENHPVWCQDFQNSPLTLPWHERGVALGWFASAALPLSKEGVVFGTFTLYAKEPNAFDEAARNLLTEMAKDINFALDNFSHEAERKKTEAELRKLSLVVEQSPSSIVITDLGAKIEYVNDAFLNATGYSHAELIGQNPRILHSGKNSRATYDDMWAHLSRGEIWKGELINRHKDGSEYIESLLISPVRSSENRITHYLAIKENITERKKAEAKVANNALRFESLLKINEMGGVLPEKEFLKYGLEFAEKLTSSKISFVHFVNEDEETIELVSWSTATTEHYCTATFDTHYPVSQAGIWADALRSKRATIVNDYFSHEGKHGLPEGHAALHRLMSVPVIEEGKVRVILGVGNKEENYTEDDLELVQLIGNDLWRIVRRMRVESELKIRFEAEQKLNASLAAARTQLLQSEKMAAIGLLAAGVAHEINNPIGYVNSNLGTLERYLADIFTVMNKSDELCELINLPNPEVAEFKALKEKFDIDFLQKDINSLLRESREGLERVKRIVLDLKNFSRLESDEHWQWSDIHAGLESTLTIVANELKYKCDVKKEFGTLPQVYCLPSQLNQVFMNLLVNAAQAIQAHGIVTIRTGSANDLVWIEISDTGSGIADDVLPRIFDPFFTTKPIGSGTGLGLPVSYGIIEHHHGNIEVHSEVGKGSTFRVTLPVQQPTIEEH